jgi:hypothetical protein
MVHTGDTGNTPVWADVRRDLDVQLRRRYDAKRIVAKPNSAAVELGCTDVTITSPVPLAPSATPNQPRRGSGSLDGWLQPFGATDTHEIARTRAVCGTLLMSECS